LLVFLLALQQRFLLARLSEKVASAWLPAAIRDREIKALRGNRTGTLKDMREAFDDIRDIFLAFTARGYFTQVVQTEVHHRYYRKWQETFQVAQMYQEVSDEISEMSGHLEMLEARKLNSTVQTLTAWSIILATIGVTAAWLAVNPNQAFNFDFFSSGQLPAGYIVAVLAVIVSVVIELFLFRRRGIISGSSKKAEKRRRLPRRTPKGDA